ncbi:undecaprenyl-diphosphatase [Candidatus Pacearchaeota archaeon]|nr:undecaprenyl-diphosphatase [Candidatus Pacearchaeota archaeon]
MATDLIAVLVLAFVQGITEWLPVSSSGHLVLLEQVTGFSGGGLELNVAVHFGTLLAVFVYFRNDIGKIVGSWLRGKVGQEHGKLGWFIVLGTIPAAIVGYFWRDVFAAAFQSLETVALGFAVTGVLLMVASRPLRRERKLRVGSALTVGLAQVLALIPGVSRSGMTISTGMLSGMKEKEALRFSFLLAIPIILGANILVGEGWAWTWQAAVGAFVAFLVGLGTIHLLYGRILRDRANLKWFGLYALVLAAVTFLVSLGVFG